MNNTEDDNMTTECNTVINIAAIKSATETSARCEKTAELKPAVLVYVGDMHILFADPDRTMLDTLQKAMEEA